MHPGWRRLDDDDRSQLCTFRKAGFEPGDRAGAGLQLGDDRPGDFAHGGPGCRSLAGIAISASAAASISRSATSAWSFRAARQKCVPLSKPVFVSALAASSRPESLVHTHAVASGGRQLLRRHSCSMPSAGERSSDTAARAVRERARRNFPFRNFAGGLRDFLQAWHPGLTSESVDPSGCAPS